MSDATRTSQVTATSDLREAAAVLRDAEECLVRAAGLGNALRVISNGLDGEAASALREVSGALIDVLEEIDGKVDFALATFRPHLDDGDSEEEVSDEAGSSGQK